MVHIAIFKARARAFTHKEIVMKTILIIFIYIEKNKLMLSIFTIFMFKDFHNV